MNCIWIIISYHCYSTVACKMKGGNEEWYLKAVCRLDHASFTYTTEE